VRKNDVGDEAFETFNLVDLGDIVGCEGTLFTTRTGEKTLKVKSFELLTKALHPLPDKHAGLTDKETRYRRRYADLIVNPEVRDAFATRSRIIQTMREFLNREGFLEVETPILQPLYGGASARPFMTHHNKLDIPMYLRIADELYLKRLIVGGYEKVWEYCKDFRNEGLDRLHNPEFSMIELYWAYADYRDMAALYERLLRHTVKEVTGGYKITYEDKEVDFEPPFRWVTMIDSIKEATGVDFTDLDFEKAKAEATSMGVAGEDLINRGKVIEAVWEARVEPNLVQPTFVADFPVEISPLAKRHREDNRLTERFELFVAGQEMGNAFSELNDPLDQLQRFLQQGKALEAGDEEAQPLDDDFITALAYGMPPTAGLGFGIDRLIMLLTNAHSIRDVIFFPQMKDIKEGAVPVSKILAQILDEEEKSG
jgi:lysyl-tRNA synthetase class 2